MRSASNDTTAFYNIPDVVKAIRELTKLSPSEQAILAMLQDQLKGQPILDVGIGAGRTTPYLRELSADYVGIDLSAKMIESARERFPDARLLQRDAADLSLFATGEFAAVFFLGAGIDDANLTDRMKVFQEIHRVLKPGGMFVLCVHNLRAREASPWSDFQLSQSTNPRVFLPDNIRFMFAYFSTGLKLLRSRARKKKHILIREYEAFPNRHPGDWLFTYYISCAAQVRQLQEAGFCNVEVRDRNGCLTDGNTAADNFLYYLACKECSVVSKIMKPLK